MTDGDRHYDFVIAGGGSAGCVLANRLSADAANRVCLIEAEPPDTSPLIHIPAGVIALINHRRLNWNWLTSGQDHAAGRQIKVPRGRTLGGSSAINGMIYMRGHPLDYDEWAEAGNVGWGFADVLPYFKKSESNETFGETECHGQGGPLAVSDLERCNPLTDALLGATNSMQFPRRADFNGSDQEGFGTRQVTIRGGRRQSTAVAFLDPARGRSNLDIITGGLVGKVLLEGGRATGVELLRDGGERLVISAAREVILSAGAVSSPAILMRSGIGDGAELAGHGIEVKHELAGVGRNLQDHISAGLQYSSPSAVPYGLSFRAAPRLAASALKYIFTRRGFFAGNMIEGGGFLRTEPGLPRPDIQYTFLPGHRSPRGAIAGWGHGYSMATVLLRPKSRGRLSLASDDPATPPLIDPCFFSEDEGMEVLLWGLKVPRNILQTPSFAPYRGKLLRFADENADDESLRAYIREFAAIIFHPVGTCAMGNNQMEGAVVDPELRIHDMNALRVVDASVMPLIIGGNTNAPTIMIAEKAADMILRQS